MADYHQLFQEIDRLNEYELLAKKHFFSKGKFLNHAQLLYLIRYGIHLDSLDELYLPSALKEQEKIEKDLKEQFHRSGLSTEFFLPENSDFEVEQLLRYVELPEHFHEFFEMSFVFTGECQHWIDNELYIQKEGSIVIIPAMVKHKLVAVDNAVALTVKLKGDYLLGLHIPNMVSLVYPLLFECEVDSAIQNILLSLYDQQKKKLPYWNELCEYLFSALFTYIFQTYRNGMQILVGGPIRDKKVNEILNYMYENYQSISLKSVAEHFCYNEAYFSRMFHQQTGITFTQALKKFKLQKAASLLRDKNWKLEYICDAVGYQDTRQFIRSFQQLYGITPGQYRKNHKSEQNKEKE